MVIEKVNDFLKEETNKVQFLSNLRNALFLRISDIRIVVAFQKFWKRSDDISQDVVDSVIDELCNELLDTFLDLEILTIKTTLPLSDVSVQIFVKANITYF